MEKRVNMLRTCIQCFLRQLFFIACRRMSMCFGSCLLFFISILLTLICLPNIMAFRFSPPAEFGNVQFSKNSNIKVNGVNNSGSVLDNSNLALSSSNSELKVSDNSNAKINVENSFLNSAKCSNLHLTGQKNKAVLTSNSNSKLEGENNDWEATSNSNLKVFGNSGILKLFNNSNGKIEGDKNNVMAKGNSNLKVSGQGNNLSITGTQNHHLQPSSARSSDEGAVNRLEITPSGSISCNQAQGTGWVSSILSSSSWGFRSSSLSSNVQFSVDYVEKAEINSGNYNLGIFDFTVKGTSPTNYVVKIDDSNVDAGSLVTRITGPSEVILSATKQGIKQSLKLQGPIVKQEASGKSYNVDMISQCNM